MDVRREIETADWPALTLSVLDYADGVIRRYYWRGCRLGKSPDRRVLANGKGADEFFSEAVDKLMDGTRAYSCDLTLEENLKRTIRSDIWNWLKKSKQTPLLDRASPAAGEEETEPTVDAPDETVPLNPVARMEFAEMQKRLLTALYDFVSDDEELWLLLMAYEDEKYKPAEIAAATGLEAARVSELKRKLADRADKFVRLNPDLAAAQPKK